MIAMLQKIYEQGLSMRFTAWRMNRLFDVYNEPTHSSQGSSVRR